MEQIWAGIAPAHPREIPTTRRDAGSTSAARDNVVCIENLPCSARERGADHPGQIDFAIWLGEQQFAATKTAIL